jgi:hypothetical protein
VPRHLSHFGSPALSQTLRAAGVHPFARWDQEIEYDVIGWAQGALSALQPDGPPLFFNWASRRPCPSRPTVRAANIVGGALLAALAPAADLHPSQVRAVEMFAQAAVLHQSSSNADLYAGQEAVVGRVPGFTSADLSVGMAKSSWSVEAYIDNAFDEHGELNRQSMCAAGSGTGYYCYTNYRVYPIKPQSFGIKFANKF